MRSITLLTAGWLLACAPATYEYPTSRSLSRSEQYMIGENRLVPGETLYEALRRTRPTLLLTRGTSSLSDFSGAATISPQGDVMGVFINGSFAGGLEVLQTLDARSVISVRRLRGIDASNRFAGRFREGVLDVRLAR